MPVFDFTSPDGKQYSVTGPDGATHEQAFSILQQQIGGQSQPTSEAPQGDTKGDILKSAGIGLAKGAIGLAGLPGDLLNLGSHALDYVAGTNIAPSVDPFAQKIGSENIQKNIEARTGEFYKPKTTGGEYAQTIGEFMPALLGGPEGIATKLATRVAAPAIASETAGQLTKGTPLEPYARVGGAVAGAGLPVALSRIASPTTVNTANAEAIKTLADNGVTALTAGQKSGSKILKYGESELGDALGAGGKATATNEKALEQFTSAAAGKAGINAPRVTPDIVDAGFTANSVKFNDAIRSAGDNIPLGDFKTNAGKVATDFKDLTGQEPTLLQKFIDRISGLKAELPSGNISAADYQNFLKGGAIKSTISGEQYQAIQSEIGSMARRTSSPELKFALYDLKGALDEAVAKGLGNSGVAQQFQAARQQYKNLLVIEKAAGKSADGLITPASLHQAAQSVGKRSFNRGLDDFSALAKAGKAILAPLPQSGTAPRAAMHLLPSVIGGGLGAGLGGLGGAIGGVAGPAIAGRILMSRPIQAYLSNQKAVALRQIPVGKNALKGGLLALPSAQGR